MSQEPNAMTDATPPAPTKAPLLTMTEVQRLSAISMCDIASIGRAERMTIGGLVEELDAQRQRVAQLSANAADADARYHACYAALTRTQQHAADQAETIARLEVERDEAKDRLTALTRLEAMPSLWKMELQGKTMQAFAELVAESFYMMGGKNSVECQLTFGDEPFILTFQRKNGLTPAQQRDEAQCRADAAEETIARLTRERDNLLSTLHDTQAVEDRAYARGRQEVLEQARTLLSPLTYEAWRTEHPQSALGPLGPESPTSRSEMTNIDGQQWLTMESAPRDGTIVEVRCTYGVAPWYGLYRWTNTNSPAAECGYEWTKATDSNMSVLDESCLMWRPYQGDVAAYVDPTGGAQDSGAYWRAAVAKKYGLPDDYFESRASQRPMLRRLTNWLFRSGQ
jgi:hypothetical protein